MKTFAFDFDDTLVDTFPVLHGWIESELGYRVSDELSARYMLDPSPDRTREILAAFFRSGADLAVKPLSGAIAACRALVEQGFELVIVTGRTLDLADRTQRVVDEQFPGIFTQIHCVGHLPDKAAALRESEAELLVDDHFRQVRRAHEAGFASVLFGDLPWSRGAHWLRRAKDWPSLIRLLGIPEPAPRASMKK